MNNITNSDHLMEHQYHDSVKLNARAALHQRFSQNPYAWQRWVFDRLDFRAGVKVLEVGCGPAGLWRENAERIPPNCQVTLTDLSPGMLAEARQHLQNQSCFEFKPADVMRLPFESESFDAAIANHMLYHVPCIETALAELHRALKPGGRLYVTTNSNNHMQALDELVETFLERPKRTRARKILSFALENGKEFLQGHFMDIVVDKFKDELFVTEAKPLVAYVWSTEHHRAIHPHAHEFTEFVHQKIIQLGSIRIQKESGIFSAYRR